MSREILASKFKHDFKEAAGPLQVSPGHEAGAKAAIHAIQFIFDKDITGHFAN